ncbi:MAG: RagB/SusD family nutrient uptake outer membrane protein [Rikenellaceae bacterium]
MKKRILFALLSLGMLSSCDLTESMQVQADKAMIFGSESGLDLYINSFYKALPTLGTGYMLDDMCDIAAVSDVNSFIREGAYTSETSTSWSWTTLRNINYFIDSCNDPDYCTVDDDVKSNAIAIARWFRAWFYYDKLTTYGEVPWFENEIQSYETDLMYKDRDSRDVIIANMISDLDYAYENISAKSSTGSSMVTKWAAAALKSRVCLFEASYRKYHELTGMTYSAADLYAEAASAAKLVMDNSGLALNTSSGTKGAYRDLFYLENPIESEVILAVCANADSGITGSANWWYNSSSYGHRWSLSKAFMNTYLMLDGSFFTSQTAYDQKLLYQEVAGRDERIEQTIRGAEFTMDGALTVANVKSVSLTGYQVIKYTLDESAYDGTSNNNNSIPLIRYAEVLLNYAEAKAELGTLTDSEWKTTIGAIRSRAGITGGLDMVPTTIDSYLQSTFYPNVTDPTILEIRRERTIELVAEGFRFDDLRRWKCGESMQDLPWDGIYIGALDQPIDVNNDGTYDYYFTQDSSLDNVASTYKSIAIQVDQSDTGLGVIAAGTNTYTLTYKWPSNDRYWYTDGRQYLYPIPASVIRSYEAEGYTLSQNANW